MFLQTRRSSPVAGATCRGPRGLAAGASGEAGVAGQGGGWERPAGWSWQGYLRSAAL